MSDDEVRWRYAYATASEIEGKKRTSFRVLETADKVQHDEDGRLLRDYSRAEHLMNATWLNVQELLEAIVARGMQFHAAKSLPEGAMAQIGDEFARRLVNVLTMFRILVDHTDTAITRRFGADSEQMSRWKAEKSAEYDSVFAYRLMDKLRNYCVHVGMPPLTLSYSASATQDAISFSINLMRAELLKERSAMKARVTSELEMESGDLPLLKILDDWSLAFWRVCKVMLQIEQEQALAAAERVLAVRPRLNLPETGGEVSLVQMPEGEENPAVLNFTISHLDEDLARRVLEGPIWHDAAAQD